MEKEVVTVKSNFKFEEIIEMFDKHPFGAMPVVDDDRKLIGIVSRTDILKVFVPDYFDMLNGLVFIDHFGSLKIEKGSFSLMSKLLLVDDLMTKNVITVNEDADLLKAIALMKNYNVRTLPVVGEKGKLVGVITRTDILKAILKMKGIIKESD